MVGLELTVTVVELTPEQPDVAVEVTLYTVVKLGLTLMFGNGELVLQL